MKKINYFTLWLLASLMLSMSACDSIIYRDLDPCELEISYKFDYNILFADAFTSQVKRVDLFIFDENGQSVASPIRVEGNPFEEGFSHPLNLAPGKYTFVAWAGLYDRSYSISNINDLNAMKVAINTVSGISDKALDHLWHGILSDVEVKGLPNEHLVIPLTKDTNTFKVNIVTTKKTSPINVEDYTVEIVSANSKMDGHNAIVPASTVTYSPYLSEVGSTPDEHDTQLVGLTYELRTGRLMASADDKMVIKDRVHNAILGQLDLKKIIWELRLSQYSSMPLQEYMDRQDEYVLTLIFDSDRPDFLSLTIVINGWLIREHNINA